MTDRIERERERKGDNQIYSELSEKERLKEIYI